MSRLPTVNREDLSAEDQATWDAIAATHRGNVTGPFGPLIHVPAMAGRVSQLEGYFRFHGQLAADERELIVCTVTREFDAAFPYAIHVGLARDAGTRDEALAAVDSKGALEGLTEREGLLVTLARTVCREHGLPEGLYDRAAKELGESVLVEVVALCGHYTLISYVVNSFDVQPPAASP